MQTVFVEQEPPEPKPWGVSDEEALELCREWMMYLGAGDCLIAAGAAREVCDLYSARYLGWVDNGRGNLGVDVVEHAASTSLADGRLSVIFVRGGIRAAAWDRAEALGVALLWFDPQNASLDGGNSIGKELCASGMQPG